MPGLVTLTSTQHAIVAQVVTKRFTIVKQDLSICSEDIHALMLTQKTVGKDISRYLEIIVRLLIRRDSSVLKISLQDKLNELQIASRALGLQASLDSIDIPFCLRVFTDVLHLESVWEKRQTIIPKFLAQLAQKNFSESMSTQWYLENVVLWAERDELLRSTLEAEEQTMPSRELDLPRFPDRSGTHIINTTEEIIASVKEMTLTAFHRANTSLTIEIKHCHFLLEKHELGEHHLEILMEKLNRVQSLSGVLKCFGGDQPIFAVDLAITFETLARIVHLRIGWAYREKIESAYFTLLSQSGDNSNIRYFQRWIAINVTDWNPCNNV